MAKRASLVSVLMPAYNAGKWIGPAISSVLAQAWSCVELIVVDDGSTDCTLDVARSFECGNVRVLSQENRGASAARNTALAAAQGDYIQWLDADDLLSRDKIARQMRAAMDSASTESTLMTCSFAEFFVRPERARINRSALWQDLSPLQFILLRFERNLWMNPGVWLTPRALADRAGPWNESLSLNEDGEYFTRLVALSSGIRFVPEALVYYRRANPTSVSRGVSKQSCDSLVLSLRLCVEHLLSLEDSPRTRAAALALLQFWVNAPECFAPSNCPRFDVLASLAETLGRRLDPPQMPRKYRPLEATLGWHAASTARSVWAGAKLRALVMLERLAGLP